MCDLIENQESQTQSFIYTSYVFITLKIIKWLIF